MKTFKYLLIMSFVVFLTCSPALSAVDVNQYLNIDRTSVVDRTTVNQEAIKAAIDGGADPISLAVELATARPDLAAEFVDAIGRAAPGVNIMDLAVAVANAVPDKKDAILRAAQALAAIRSEEFSVKDFTARTTPQEEYQQTKKGLSPST